MTSTENKTGAGEVSGQHKDRTREAKRRALANIVTNIVLICTTAVIGIVLTPYYIQSLGLDVYGLIPLCLSVVAYLALFARAIEQATYRFVAIQLGKDEFDTANEYLNSALLILLVLCGILVPLAAVLAALFSAIFDVPDRVEAVAGLFFFLLFTSVMLQAFKGPFLSAIFVKHRFDLKNFVEIGGQLLRLCVILLAFSYWSPSLKYVGLAYLGMAVFTLGCLVPTARRLVPQLRVRFADSSKRAFHDIRRMATWIAIDQVGTMFLLGSGLIVINLLLGSTECGRFGTITPWVLLLKLFGTVVSDLFTPVAFAHVSQESTISLVDHASRAVRFMGLLAGLPVGLFCGLAAPLLTVWLGSDFATLAPLACLVIAPWQFNIAVRPLLSIFKGFDKVKMPAIATVVIGGGNVILSASLVYWTSVGIWGVAISLFISLLLKNMAFTPLYSARLCDQSWTRFYPAVLPGMGMASGAAIATFIVSRQVEISSIAGLLIVVSIATFAYLAICWFLLLSDQDQQLIKSIVINRGR